MAIAKKYQPKLDNLKETLDMLIGGGLAGDQINSMLSPKILELETEANVKINLVSSDGKMNLDVVDLSKDYVRVREPNDESKVLRTKIFGVEIDVKTLKEGKFNFANEDVVKALRSLADEVEALPIEINSLENADVRKDVSVDETGTEDLEDLYEPDFGDNEADETETSEDEL